LVAISCAESSKAAAAAEALAYLVVAACWRVAMSRAEVRPRRGGSAAAAGPAAAAGAVAVMLAEPTAFAAATRGESLLPDGGLVGGVGTGTARKAPFLAAGDAGAAAVVAKAYRELGGGTRVLGLVPCIPCCRASERPPAGSMREVCWTDKRRGAQQVCDGSVGKQADAGGCEDVCKQREA
jgi:hypothetical protein